LNAIRKDLYKTLPLCVQTFDNREINEAIESLKSGNLTMGKKCAQFEQDFAKYVNCKHAIFVNSGSTANLLMVSALINPSVGLLEAGDEVIVPALTWGTTLWPIIQHGLVPVLVDCDIETLCIDVKEIEKNVTPSTKAVFVAHILGNGAAIEEIRQLCDTKGLVLLEDNCESLGAAYKDKKLGSFGLMGSFSFFFSHHITTIEGGMIVTDDDEIADLLRCLRAHGWSRDLKDKSVEEDYRDIDPRFLFCNVGYSVRPTEIQGAFGIHQLKKLDLLNLKRRITAEYMLERFQKYPLMFTKAGEDISHTWFAFPVLGKAGLSDHLSKNGIETRPIIAGTLAKHPALKLYKHRTGDLYNSDMVMDRGLYWGCHPFIAEEQIDYLDKVLGGFL